MKNMGAYVLGLFSGIFIFKWLKENKNENSKFEKIKKTAKDVINTIKEDMKDKKDEPEN